MLLILAGVALATLTGQGNIIGNAENAVSKYNNSVASEQQLLNEIEKYFQNYLEGGNEDNPPTPPIPEVDENGLAIDNVTITTDEENVQIVIPAGFAPAILKGSDSTYSLPGQDGSVKEIMPAEEWYSITAEQINQGIVIVDNAITYDSGQPTGTIPDFNEYVWVPIPEDKDFARIYWNGPYYAQNYEIEEHPLSEVETKYYFYEDKTSSEYINMINSVKFYKGFYIGRYEATDGMGTSDVACTKRNCYMYSTIGEAEIATDRISPDNPNQIENAHLMYGIEWDSTLSWLIDNAVIKSKESGKTKIMSIDDIQTDSSSWGYYSNSNKTEEDMIYISGSSEYIKANNIYGLAGGLWECTQEKYLTERRIGTGYSDVVRTVRRGGEISENGDYMPAAFRDGQGDSFTIGTNLRISH